MTLQLPELSQDTVFDAKSVLATLSSAPGVYRMLDAENAVLYVGKARSLKKRVSSYFNRPQLEPRIAAMVSRVRALETTVTRTEREALLLEAELIKSLKPKYNVLLRDDKSFPYIVLTLSHGFPRLGFHRGSKTNGERYFGPFPSAGAVRETLNLMQKLFRVRQCEDSYYRARSRPCLQHQIGRCTAPCVGLIDAEAYAADVRLASLFLEGRADRVLDELNQAMDKASAALEFEQAAAVRDRIQAVRAVQASQSLIDAEQDADVLGVRLAGGLACVHMLYFRNGLSLGGRSFYPRAPADASEAEVLGAFVSQYYAARPAPSRILLSAAIEDADFLAEALADQSGHRVEIRHAQRGARVKLVDLALRNADAALAAQRLGDAHRAERWAALARLLDMNPAPTRVECFDVSHSHGEATVASCVVFDPEGPVKAQYRRYNITGVAPGDDYAAMRQAIERRFRRAVEEGGVMPELLLIDGGRGQVAEALAALEALDVCGINVLGVAKGPSRKAGLEELVRADGRAFNAPPNDPGLHLIQQIRDEAHRFAITGHRGRRDRKRERSQLEEISGIGARRRQALLRHFGGLPGILNASIEDLARVDGIDRALAERVYASLHGQ
jgi:excinuclease ABC subunit C